MTLLEPYYGVLEDLLDEFSLGSLSRLFNVGYTRIVAALSQGM